MTLPLAAASIFEHLNYQSPKITSDGKVTFQLEAPTARQVAVLGLPGVDRVPLTQGPDGRWRVTVGPLSPDVYSYRFDVDGTRVLDPRNRSTKAWLTVESTFEISAHGERTFAWRNVPHGIVHHHTFASQTRQGAATAFRVYTPPGYDSRAATAYPVTVLMHGFGDDESAWDDFGRAPLLLDNLIADHRAQPMVVVMTNGHPSPLPFGEVPDSEDYFPPNLDLMRQEVLHEVLPQIESSYHVRRDRDGRAIAGLSMGGGHALGIGLNALDQFGSIGAFSSAVPEANFDTYFGALPTAQNAPEPAPRLLWIACGRDDFLLDRNLAFVAWLRARNLPYTWIETSGGHTWQNWRDYLEQFLPLLFRAN